MLLASAKQSYCTGSSRLSSVNGSPKMSRSKPVQERPRSDLAHTAVALDLEAKRPPCSQLPELLVNKCRIQLTIASVHGLVASLNKAYLAAKHKLVSISEGVALGSDRASEDLGK